MRWTRSDRARIYVCADGRRFADGEIVWSWPPGAEAQRNALARCRDTGAIQPVPGESAYKPLKPTAQGRPDVRLRTCGSAACFFVARGPWVRPAPGLLCALDCFGGRPPSKARRESGREDADVCFLLRPMAGRILSTCHSGAPAGRTRNPFRDALSGEMDSGFARSARPGMTMEGDPYPICPTATAVCGRSVTTTRRADSRSACSTANVSTTMAAA
jgi:hypothetical protein